MRILFVEDEPNKAREVKKFLNSKIPLIEIDEKKSYFGAISSIRENEYELILLDMSLPLFDDGDPEDFETFAGIDILEELKRIESKSKVIVITAFDILPDGTEQVTLEELREEMTIKYEKNFIEAIHYNISSIKWKESLIEYISKFELGELG